MAGITEAELRFARLKLAAFSALAGWGRNSGEPMKIGDREFPRYEPNSFEDRMRLADDLVAWCLKASH